MTEARKLFIFFALRENISVVIKICAQPTYSGIYSQKKLQRCHFASTVSQFIIELCSPGERKVSNRHVPMTEAELLIFPELFFSSPDKSH